MVASASVQSSFSKLSGYLGGGEERVGWIETRNAFADDVPGTVAEMSEQAGLSTQTQKPVYHLTIAFDPSDNPTEAEIRGAVDRTLRDVGLENHQALVVRHVDREHAHVHVMVNRVGPDGRAWSTSHDRRRLRASVEQQERELGVRWTGKNARAAGASRETDRGFAREVRDRALGDFKEAATWGDLDTRLRAKGLRIERRGRGAVVTDGKREVKLSSVSRTVSRPRLEARLGSLAAHQRAPNAETRNEPRRTASEAGEARGASQRQATHSRQRRSGALKRNALRTRRVGRAVGRAIATDGERDADEVFARTALRMGSRAVVRTASRGRRRASGAAAPERATGDGASYASRTFQARVRARDGRRGGRVDRMEGAVRDHAQTARLAAEREKALRAVARIEEAASAAVRRAQQALAQATQASDGARRAFGASMAETYSDPDRAAQAFLRDADARGLDRAARRMVVDPEPYGALKASPATSRYSLVRGTTTEPARKAAPLAARRGRAFVEARQDVLKAETDVRRAGEVHRTVSSELSGLDEIARGARVDEFGPAAVRARLERLDKALRERSARAPGVRLTPARVDGPTGKALASRVGSVGMVTAKKAAKAASRALGRDE